MQKARSHATKDAPTACRQTVSGTVSLPCYGCFSPFPHGTGTLSVSGEYLALADGPAGFTQGSTCPALLRILLEDRRYTRKGLSPAAAALSRTFRLTPESTLQSYNPATAGTAAVWALPRSLATTGGITFCFLLLRLLRCFSSPGSPP